MATVALVSHHTRIGVVPVPAPVQAHSRGVVAPVVEVVGDGVLAFVGLLLGFIYGLFELKFALFEIAHVQDLFREERVTHLLYVVQGKHGILIVRGYGGYRVGGIHWIGKFGRLLLK